MFKIITCTWDAGGALFDTLSSVEVQTRIDWQVHVIDDNSNAEQQRRIAKWCDYNDHWTCTLNTEQRYGPRNQYEGVRAMDPQPGDIIVFLDGDGDELATPETLNVIKAAYDRGALLTYGSLETKSGAQITGASEYPPDVVEHNSYRYYTRDEGTCFNHLRTVSWDILSQIPEWNFKWPDGRWFEAGTDYVVMIPALELAWGKYEYIKETTLLYNDTQPHPDYLHHGDETSRCCTELLSRPMITEVLDAL